MGGGVAMSVAGKIAGVYGRFRGAFPALPKNVAPAAYKAIATRPITGVISSSDTQFDAASSTVTKPLNELAHWELAEQVASSCDVGQPLPRLVFGGAPNLKEAEDATFYLCSAIDQAYLSNESSEGSYLSDMGHDKLAVSDSGHLESKACIKKSSAPNCAFQAFQLLRGSAAVQTAVASIATDQNVIDAFMKNEALSEFFKSQCTGTNLEELTADTKIPGYQAPKYSDDAKGNEEEPKNGFNSFFKDIKSRLENMMNSLSGFIENRFAGPAAADGSDEIYKTMASQIDNTMAVKIMGLVVMVVMIVVFKRCKVL